jgi:hypothetical protein
MAVELIRITIFNELFAEGEVIIGEYSPRRSRGEYSPIITEPEANNCFSIFTQVCFLGLNLFYYFIIIGEYSPRRSRGEYSPIITEPR